ncbi:DNA-directed RNA polymerase subunit beta, putative [Theileria equi strain WA]|uniref:DNA-directed RNA polymerase subunit beta n=1 Tax=Theileria equi strain WA TaxID=1537102 RepID=L0B144_THEEQ|nr:DNA-directed RNA polymerase subunit beta, putative [Theileria equi strain WA]AFZ81233.1 DNA-directed RNA polymerase subunit beta, putative [Theileria equi strain WA]|eukprot:XP_004830899.1 DNA-directed RNA polymerase subunit beta, putative [Theileria equi strain WA]
MVEFNVDRMSISHSHVDSFNAFIDHYSVNMVKRIPPVYISCDNEYLSRFLNPNEKPYYVKITVLSLKIGYPTRPGSECIGIKQHMYPRHAKTSHTTYEAPLVVTFGIKFSDTESIVTKELIVGHIPVMVKSKRCNLSGLTPEEMVQQGEDIDEPGGYFIIRGVEKIIRQVIITRSNYPIAIKSENNSLRNVLFTDYSIVMRCQSHDDGCYVTNVLYLTINKRCMFRVLIKNSVVLIPLTLLLRALVPYMSDDELKQKLLQNTIGDEEMTTYYHQFFLDMIRCDPILSDIDFTENRYLYRLGKVCWSRINQYLHPGATFEECAVYFLKYFVIIHAHTNVEKFETLLFMFNKLIKLSRGEIQSESYDSFAFQEILLPGQTYSCILKESLYLALTRIKKIYSTEISYFGRYLQGDVSARSKRKFMDFGENQDSSTLIKQLLSSVALFNYATDKIAPLISKRLLYFLSSGNALNSHFELNQSAGFVVVADRINYHRFASHFRSIHRGNIFTKMRSTEVRRLLGETWGFICPVHTPDGAPCGLLLHISQYAVLVTDPKCDDSISRVKQCLKHLGYCVDLCGNTLITNYFTSKDEKHYIPILVDGIPICTIPSSDSMNVYNQLRQAKLNGNFGMKQHYEIIALPDSKTTYSNISVMTYPGRMIRPVRCVKTGNVEWIGPITQLWSTIAVSEYELSLSHSILESENVNKPHIAPSISETLSLHRNKECNTNVDKFLENAPVSYEFVELKPSGILSVIAALTPFSNHNQSPRNMYQCQMLKQSMGVPYHCETYRSDNKSYRLITPQKPLVTTEEYRKMGYDDYSTGINAIVAVIAHSGFDMEDAMILNKASLDRGAFHGCIYKTKIIDAMPPSAVNKDSHSYYFNNINDAGNLIIKHLDKDGLPSVGQKVKKGMIFCRVEARERQNGEIHITERLEKYDDEEGVIDQVTLVGFSDSSADKSSSSGIKCTRVVIKLRIVRNPVVGDKFASRHGQKGILSMTWPVEDMPFLESGIVPDIIFNPHGLPSRMTVGKLIECMAGKSAAVHGQFQDATCFRKYPKQSKFNNRWIDQNGIKGWNERGQKYASDDEGDDTNHDDVVDYFGKTLLMAGYDYYGTEAMYCGTLGTEIQAHIFVGCIFYQRLRHMVADKAQVRATGPIDTITKQPVKGKKNLGGIRFGEMERDALIAHGTSQLLQDRLMHCSDGHFAYVCPKCGSIISATISSVNSNTGKIQISQCRICKVGCKLVMIPYVLRYVANELATMNIGIKLHLSQLGTPINL